MREGDHLPAYQAAVRVYKRYHPTVSDAAARDAVNKIILAVARGDGVGGMRTILFIAIVVAAAVLVGCEAYDRGWF